MAADPASGWRLFIERDTPALLALIERLDIRDRDEAMELYTLVCERLSENRCARLRRFDASRGSLRAWLAVVVRHVAADWVRSRAGRRRLFGAIQALDATTQQVFQLFYWEGRSPREIAEDLTSSGRPTGVIDVLSALDVVNETLTERHYSELVTMTARAQPAVSLDAALEAGAIEPADPGTGADARLAEDQRDAAFARALAALPVEDAAIVRLHYFNGLSLMNVQRALHLPSLTRSRVTSIVEALRSQLSRFATRAPVAASPAVDAGGGA